MIWGKVMGKRISVILLVLVLSTPLTADETKVSEPPDNYTGTAPVDNGSLVALTDQQAASPLVAIRKKGTRAWS
jgi:hypothetical protein